jgi:hypothetical protein
MGKLGLLAWRACAFLTQDSRLKKAALLVAALAEFTADIFDLCEIADNNFGYDANFL